MNRTVQRKKIKKSHYKRKRERILFLLFLLETFGKLVIDELLEVGYWLEKQSSPDKTRAHLCSEFFGKSSTTEK